MNWKENLKKGANIIQEKAQEKAAEAKQKFDEAGGMEMIREKTKEATKTGIERSKTLMERGESIAKQFYFSKPEITFDDSSAYSVENDCLSVISSSKYENVTFDILQYDSLKGSVEPSQSQNLYYFDKSGIRLKQIRATLEDSSIIVEDKSLDFCIGDFTFDVDFNYKNNIQSYWKAKRKVKLIKKTGENPFKPRIIGSGQAYLTPSFDNFVFLELNDEKIIVDKGLFYCCSSDIKADVSLNPSVKLAISRILKSDEEGKSLSEKVVSAFSQVSLSGKGICVLCLRAPESEIVKINLTNNVLRLNGDHVLLIKGDITHTTEGIWRRRTALERRYGQRQFGEKFVGYKENSMHVLSGTGEVWIEPTSIAYDFL